MIDAEELDNPKLDDLFLAVGLPKPVTPSTMVRPLQNAGSYTSFLQRWSPHARTPCEAAWKIPYYREMLTYLAHSAPSVVGYELHLQTPLRVGNRNLITCAVFQLRKGVYGGHPAVVVCDPQTKTVYTGGEWKD